MKTNPFRTLRRGVSVVSVLSAYFVCSLFVRDESAKFRLLSRFSRLVLRALDFRISVDPRLEEFSRSASIVVSNHASYLDIPLIASLVPSQFVSTFEARRLPFFGFLIERMGCLLIDRGARGPRARAREIEAMTESLRSGKTVTFFPEAKSSSGSELLFFHRRFFEPAHALGRSALALSIEWRTLGGLPIDTNNRERVLWFRQNSLFEHVLGLFSEGAVELRVHASLIDSNVHADPAAFADACRAAIERTWRPIPDFKAGPSERELSGAVPGFSVTVGA